MSNEIVKILIPAVGGQGGGVLTEWLYQSFLIEGYEVQTVSLPGLAQRTGSTVYYIEAYKSDNSGKKIIFSQHPVPGEIDIILAQEFLELGRILEQGFGSKNTKIVSSTHRVYSTLEKLPVSSGIFSDEKLKAIATEFSCEFIGVDAIKVAENNEMNELAVNAILLGVLSQSKFLPFEISTFTKSIEVAGIAAEMNLKAFYIGCNLNLKDRKIESLEGKDLFDKIVNSIGVKVKESDKKILQNLVVNKFPNHLKELILEAIIRLYDYQDIGYSKEYIKIIDDIYMLDKNNPDNDLKLTEIVIRNLALLMSYEDGIRVAELKIRSSRFKKIKEDMSITENQIFRVTDYLKPDAEEIYGLLPNIIVEPALKLFSNPNSEEKNKTMFGQKPETTSFLGFFRLLLLSKFKFLRKYSYRYKKEHANIKKYLVYIKKYSVIDYELGCLVAKSGSIIKGYGKVRRRTINTFHRSLENIVDKSYESVSMEESKKIVSDSLNLISQDENGIDKAEQLVFGSAVENNSS